VYTVSENEVLLLVADVFWLIADEKEEKSCLPEKMGDYSYTKLERLTKRPEFQKVLAEGEKKRIGRLCTVFSLPNGLNRKRLGVIASKKVGNAVARNRVKRSIRETFRQIKHRMTPAVDIVVISGKEMVAESYKVIDEKLSNALLAIK
jgi:ribonuclease P protein component